MLALLTRFRRSPRQAKPRPQRQTPLAAEFFLQAAAPTVRPTQAPAAPTPTTQAPPTAPAPVTPRPSPPPPRRTPPPAAVPPVTPPSGRRISKLDALTPVLGRKRAGQALWAPQLLTGAERQKAARILKELDQ